MKTPLILAAVTLGFFASPLQATLSMWQGEVGTGTATVYQHFTAINSPVVLNIGTLTGDRSLEFVFNANSAAVGSVSSALIGTQSVADGRQGLKYEQWQDTGFFGATAFGVADHTSTAPVQDNVDLHAVFTSDGTTTLLYVNGVLAAPLAMGLALTGQQGVGAAVQADGVTFFDVLPGTIYGFASYDSALSAGEILAHYNAFAAVPEPATATLALAAVGLAAARRRRRFLP